MIFLVNLWTGEYYATVLAFASKVSAEHYIAAKPEAEREKYSIDVLPILT